MNGCGHNLVLIETYWNVKDGTEAYPITSEHVLIETYWNVKSRKL